ncbi:MAG: 6-phosphofructokinase [Clostridia bacterium]|nr:6-phosphofructokinase [Clostridia bacterium]
MALASKHNVLITYGGGLVDPAAFVLMGLAKGLFERGAFNQIYIGCYSFESLYKRELWKKYDSHLERELEGRRGTYFGTCRGIDMTEEPYKSLSIQMLKKEKISTIVIAGGDGSARNAAEMQGYFEEHGICVVFAIPLTIDGINGSTVIGRRQAKRESIRQTENIVAASLQTRDNGKYSVVIVELQGRNRDDILERVLESFVDSGKVSDFDLDEILLIVIPATLSSNIQKLIETVKGSERRTLILISEGAEWKVENLAWLIEEYGLPKRKVRNLAVGHPSQANNQTTEQDKTEYQKWIDFAVESIACRHGESFSTSLSEEKEYRVQPLSYYAERNPRHGQQVKLPEEEIALIRRYMI